MKRGDSLLIGRIVGFHGVRGVVKVQCYIDSLTVFDDLNELWIENEENGLNRIVVEKIKLHGKNTLFAFEGIDDRNSAEPLLNKCLFIDKNRLPEPGEDEYYWKDLIGIKVYDLESDLYLGTLRNIIQTGSNDVYAVEKDGEEILIPAIISVVKSINIEKCRMLVDLPEGLI